MFLKKHWLLQKLRVKAVHQTTVPVMWSQDYHVHAHDGTSRVCWPPIGVKVHDKQLSRTTAFQVGNLCQGDQVHQPGTMACVLTPENHRSVFYKLFTRMKITMKHRHPHFVCTLPCPSMCEGICPSFNRSMLIIATIRYEQGPDQSPQKWQALKRKCWSMSAGHPKSVVAAKQSL